MLFSIFYIHRQRNALEEKKKSVTSSSEAKTQDFIKQMSPLYICTKVRFMSCRHIKVLVWLLVAAVVCLWRQKNTKQSNRSTSRQACECLDKSNKPGQGRCSAALLSSSQTHLFRVFHNCLVLKPQGEGSPRD